MVLLDASAKPIALLFASLPSCVWCFLMPQLSLEPYYLPLFLCMVLLDASAKPIALLFASLHVYGAS